VSRSDHTLRRTFAPAAASLREVAKNRSLRRIEISWAIGNAADWAFLIVLLLVAYDAGGALAAGILSAVRVVPAILAAPFAASVVERFRGDRVLTAINATRAAGAVVTALVVGLDLPVEVTYVLAAVVAGVGALVRPIQMALLPALARTPSELVAANVALSMGEGLGTFVGPVLAGVVVGLTGSMAASILVAAAFAAAAAAATGIAFEYAPDARGGGGVRGRTFELRDMPSALMRYPLTRLLVAGLSAQVFIRGLLITFLVVASIELLDMGESGVGLLNGALGLGGLIGAVASLALQRGRGLSAVFLCSLAVWGAPLLLIAAWPGAGLALAALFVVGLSNASLDVSGFTLVQRDVSNEDRVVVFSAMEGLFGVAMLLGSLLAPALLALLGTRGALAAAGAVLPALALLTARSVSRGAHAVRSSEERLALLRRDPLFAPLPLTALDRLAETAREVSLGEGGTLMRKGEPGDDYFVLVSGEVDVVDGERHLRTCGAGEGVGEIALIRRIPRTATVRARTPVHALAIDGETFVSALAGPGATAAADALISARLGHEHEPELV
jgi:Cyclic nucleotide-binding domain/Major Facilitator Superfamily